MLDILQLHELRLIGYGEPLTIVRQCLPDRIDHELVLIPVFLIIQEFSPKFLVFFKVPPPCNRTCKTGGKDLFPVVRCIAVPLLDYSNISVGALSVSVPTIRLYKKAQEHIEHALFNAGREISLKMGTTHPLYAE